MGLFEDITRNQTLVEMTGQLGSYLLEQKRKRDFAKATNLYNNELERLRRQEGSRLSVDGLKKMQDASLSYLSEASKIGKDYEKRAQELAQANERLFSSFVNNAQNIAKRIEEEEKLQRDLLERQVLANVINHPLYSQYERLRRSMTARELGGEKGTRLSELRAQIIADADPHKVAPLKTAQLLESIPFREPVVSAAAFGYQKQKEEDYMRVMSAAAAEDGLKLVLSRDEAKRIVDKGGYKELERIIQDRIKQGKYQLPAGVNSVADAVSLFAKMFERDYANAAFKEEAYVRGLAEKERREREKNQMLKDKSIGELEIKIRQLLQKTVDATKQSVVRRNEPAFISSMYALAYLYRKRGAPKEVALKELKSEYKKYLQATGEIGFIREITGFADDIVDKKVAPIIESAYSDADYNEKLKSTIDYLEQQGLQEDEGRGISPSGVSPSPSSQGTGARRESEDLFFPNMGQPSRTAEPSQIRRDSLFESRPSVDSARADSAMKPISVRVKGTSSFIRPESVTEGSEVSSMDDISRKEELKRQIMGMTSNATYKPELVREYIRLASYAELQELMDKNRFLRAKLAVK